jgi:hypothetical protein
MTRNPLKEGNITETSVGTGIVARKKVLGRAEELAMINGDWLHQLTASDFGQARQQLRGEYQMLQAARASARVDSRLV